MTSTVLYNNTPDNTIVDEPKTEQEIVAYKSYITQTWFFEDLKDEPDLYEDYREDI